MTTQLSNRPPTDVDPLRQRLDEDYAGLVERTSDLIEAAARVPQQLDEETLRRATDFVGGQMKRHKKAVDAQRVQEKEPFLSGQRIVDGFFGEMIRQLTAAIGDVETKINAYLREKAAEERRRREEDAARMRAAAEAAAASMASADDMDAALKAEQAAEDAARRAQAKPAEMVRTHGAHGGVATLRGDVAHEITDPQAAAATLWRYIDPEALAKAARARIRAGGADFKQLVKMQPAPGLREPGIRFFMEEKALIR